MTKNWYSTVTNKGSAHEQGLIIDYETGENIAVSYKPENVKLLAAAPELLEMLKTLVNCPDYKNIKTQEMRDAATLIYITEN